jgi:hypothetical protein
MGDLGNMTNPQLSTLSMDNATMNKGHLKFMGTK